MMETVSSIRIKGGSLYLSVDLYQKYFTGLESAALLDRDGKTVLMPLQPGAGGGLLMKIMNAKGDRVIHAQEYLQFIGVGNDRDVIAEAHWDSSLMGLVLSIPND